MRRALLLLGLLGCGETAYDEQRGPMRAFDVRIVEGTPLGTEAEPLPFPSAEPARIPLVLEARDADGKLLEAYNAAALLSVVPGRIDETGRRVKFVGGRAEVTAEFRFSYGPTRIWIEDAGEDFTLDCANGLDDDLDGVLDAADPDCQQPEGKRPEAKATLAVGLSAPLYFSVPRIRDLQYSPRCTTDSPLGGENLTIDQGESGRLIVTGTTQSGLYVTDLAGPEGGYNSVFLFTFSNPGGVKPGDRLCTIAGNVAEFIGNSQLNFPSFVNGNPERGTSVEGQSIVPCAPNASEVAGAAGLPTPHLLGPDDVTGKASQVPPDFYRVCGPGDTPIPGLDDATDCDAARSALPAEIRRQSPIDCARDNFAMEPWEHSLVTFQNVKLGTRFEVCDLNDDGSISRGGGNPEGVCDEECNADPLCTNALSLEQFGQFAAGLDCVPVDPAAPPVAGEAPAPASGFRCAAKVYVSTRDTLGKSGYDVMEHVGEDLAAVVGHLRQTQPGAGVDTIWIVEPRSPEDFVPAVEAP
jgi:hypothetical protein